MTLRASDLDNAARLLASTPTAAPSVRLQIVQSPSVAEAVFAAVSLTRLLAQEAERGFEKMFEQLRSDRERLRSQVKAIDAAIEKMKGQLEKIEQVAQKFDVLRQAMKEAVGSDPGCRPNRSVVAARVAKLKELQAAAESTAAALEDVRYRTFLEWFRRILEQIPVLFAIPGWG
jgi:DNA repair exonuclease SbcCD ATPase subunit